MQSIIINEVFKDVQIGSKDTGRFYVITFFMDNILLFPFSRKLSVFYTILKYKSSCLQVDLPHGFNMWMLNMSWPWAVLGLRFWITSESNCWNRLLSVFLQRFKGSSLELFIREHCLAERQLNNSAFFLKSARYLFWWNKGGIRWIFLLFNNVSILTSTFLQFVCFLGFQ